MYYFRLHVLFLSFFFCSISFVFLVFLVSLPFCHIFNLIPTPAGLLLTPLNFLHSLSPLIAPVDFIPALGDFSIAPVEPPFIPVAFFAAPVDAMLHLLPLLLLSFSRSPHVLACSAPVDSVSCWLVYCTCCVARLPWTASLGALSLVLATNAPVMRLCVTAHASFVPR